MVSSDRKHKLRGMSVITTLFSLRVLGQFVVARGKGGPLPPMRFWQSGLLPYPLLLLSQLGILLIQLVTIGQLHKGSGPLTTAETTTRNRIRLLSIIYGIGNGVRFGLGFRRCSTRNWYGSAIPIMFHALLARYLYLYADALTQRTTTAPAESHARVE